ncbi:non-ribosomal peptide synthetase, partial [Janthinobacterium sp. BJB426]|uniref:condensation domain-containing protein n=2 Tax=unclassified Janthinobacterium TaxID=2610881 RepID=UPI000C0F361D
QAALPITAVFEAQTLAALALRIEQAGPAEAQPIVHRGPGRAPLSHGQQRLWLIDQMGDGASVQYHMPMALELRGELNVALLQQALQLVVQRHEILRTTYASDGDHAWQEVQEVATLALPVLAVEDEAAMEMAIEAEAGRPFNLRCELPLRAQLLRLAPQRHVLVLVLHHIASDGWSGAIAVDEWCEAYAALVEGRAPGWQALPVQYADYARWQREAPQQARHAQQLTYWQQKLASLPEVHSLPLDHPRPAQQSFEGALLHSRLDAQVSSRLRA